MRTVTPTLYSVLSMRVIQCWFDLMYEIIPKHLPAEAIHEYLSLINPENRISLIQVEEIVSSLLKAIPGNSLKEIYSSDRIATTQTDFYYSVKFSCCGKSIDGGPHLKAI